MKILFTLLCFPFFLDLHAQTKEYESLLNVAFGKLDRIFVYKTPVPILFREKNIYRLARHFKMYYHTDIDLDTNVLAQLIQNSKQIDTTAWTEEELPKFLLVSSRTETVSSKYAVNKLSLTDKKQIRSLKRKIRRFNFTNAYDKDIYYFSRPVFSDSKNYAIIKWSDGHSSLGGGGGITLYQLIDNKWITIGELESWKY